MEPYLAGRKNERGASITPITVIPHNPELEYGGMVAQSEFGMCPNIILIEGYGNGGSVLRLTEGSLTELMGAPGEVTPKQLEERHIAVVGDVEEE